MIKFATRLSCLAIVALGIAAAASSYKLTVYAPVTAGSIAVAPGQYLVEVKGDKVVLTQGKKAIEIPATVEKGGEKKYSATTYVTVDSKMLEIDLAGTTEKVVLSGSAPANSGTK
jgi:hypothetical protein